MNSVILAGGLGFLLGILGTLVFIRYWLQTPDGIRAQVEDASQRINQVFSDAHDKMNRIGRPSRWSDW